MSDNFKNYLIQLKKDCSQMQYTLENMLEDPEFNEISPDILDMDSINDRLNDVNQLWNDINDILNETTT